MKRPLDCSIGGTSCQLVILQQIEAILKFLKSRPVTYISNDANDSLAVTPGQFMIGKSITALPYPATNKQKETATTARQKRMEKFIRDF